jgi:UDP-N-acetylglucosamine 2-epimerase (non-hydrolysing)/GDP/UDP-N,N'-diacetylbacillosamine 2-epimerase (hydrolysing)
MLTTALPSHDEVARHLGVVRLGQPLVLLTHHPTTLGGLDPLQEITEVIDGVTQALASHPTAQVVMTRANADAGGMAINAALAAVAARDRRFVLTGDLGAPRYWSLLSVAQVMVGNSSSGILEAPSFDLPVINIGDRQHGRLRVHDVCDVPTDRDAIAEAVSSRLLSPRAAAPPHASAYGDGHARARIRAAIEDLVDTLATKRQSKDQP